MASEQRASRITRLKAVASVLLGLLLLAGVVAAATYGSPRRKYPERKQVRYWHMWTAEWKVVVERYVDWFNRSQDEYEVVPLSIPQSGGANAKFMLGVAGGDPPDVMSQWFNIIPAWASKGLLTPLDSLMSPEEWAQFQQRTYPIALKLGVYKDHLYGLTTGVNARACYYHPSHLRAAGLDPDNFPKTLEELTEWGARLDRVDKKGRLVRVGFLPNVLMGFAPLFGGGFWDAGQQRLTLNTPQNLRALEYLTQLRRKHGFDEVIRFNSGLSTTGSNSGTDWPFISGAFSIVVDGQWRVKQLADLAPDLEYGVAFLPAPAGGVPGAGWGTGNYMIIPKGAQEVEGAWKFMRFVSGMDDPSVSAEICTWGGWLPLNDRVANTAIFQKYLEDNPHFRTFVEVIRSPNLQPAPPVPFQDYLVKRVQAAEDASIIRGTLTPQQSLERLENEMAREMQRRKALGYEE